MKNNKGIALIGIIIVLVVAGLISGGFYYYLSKQITEVPSNNQKPNEEAVKSPEVNFPTEGENPTSSSEEFATTSKPEEPTVKKCSNGTIYSQCSTNKPSYCENGNLINKCSACGCPLGQQCQTNGSCETIQVTCQNECSQLGLKQCYGNGYRTCGNYDVDSCLEWNLTTNCPANTICQNGNCVQQEQKCVDGTIYGQCSKDKPFYCNNSKVISNCNLCGCPTGQRCDSGGCITYNCESDSDCDDGKSGTIDRCEQFNCTYRPGLIGNIKIAIVEFEAAGTSYPANFFSSLNNKETRTFPIGPYKDPFSGKEFTESFYSFYYLENFFEQEAQRYGKSVSVSVDVLGPYSISDTPPARRGIDPCEPTLGDFFEGKSNSYNLDFSSYDVVNYVYFSNQANAFYGCAGRNKNTYLAAQVIVNAADLGYLSSTVIQVAHETAHKFSASDKYSGWGCIYPDGFVEPNKNPLYPQLEGCLMCGNIPIAEKSVRTPADFSEIKICPKTAEEMGLK